MYVCMYVSTRGLCQPDYSWWKCRPCNLGLYKSLLLVTVKHMAGIPWRVCSKDMGETQSIYGKYKGT